MLILDAQDVWRCLPMSDAIGAMSEALCTVAADKATLPVRTQLGVDASEGTLLVMPALAPRDAGDALAVKVVSVFAQNPRLGLPTVNATVLALSPETGVVDALLEGSALTAIRTAACSGAATQALARADASTAAILGAGVQAHSHALAMCAVREISELRICARRSSRAEELARRLTDRDGLTCRIVVADSADDAVAGADLVCTTTAATQPLFAPEAIGAGTHINAVGSFQPEMQEIPDACVARARVFVDHMASAMEEAGDLLGPIARGTIDASHIVAQIGEVLAENAPGRQSEDDVTLFKSVGNAAEDAVAASVALAAARRQGLGKTLAL